MVAIRDSTSQTIYVATQNKHGDSGKHQFFSFLRIYIKTHRDHNGDSDEAAGGAI